MNPKSLTIAGIVASALGSNVLADQIDTEHLFGFTIGTDIGDVGEKEIEAGTTARLGKRSGSYTALAQTLSFEYTPARNLRLEVTAAGAYHGIVGVPGLDDRRQAAFDGLSFDARYRLLDRANAPFGLAINVEPHWGRVDQRSAGRPARRRSDARRRQGAGAEPHRRRLQSSLHARGLALAYRWDMVAGVDGGCCHRTHGANSSQHLRWRRRSISSQLRRARPRSLRGPRIVFWSNGVCQAVRALVDRARLERPGCRPVRRRNRRARPGQFRAPSGHIEVRRHVLTCVTSVASSQNLLPNDARNSFSTVIMKAP